MDQQGVIKYLITKIDNEPHILCVNKCNFCPFFSLDEFGFECFCVREDKINPKLISKTNSVTYANNKRYTTHDIKRPDWCGLDEFLIGDNINNYMYYRSGNHTISCEKINNPEQLPIIFDNYLKFSKGNIVKDNKKIERENFELIKQKNKNVCSCCGLNKDNVDRNKNMGLCDDCYNDIRINYNNDKLSFIYINNFRLKRKSTYSKSTFKKIIDNNFYNGIV